MGTPSDRKMLLSHASLLQTYVHVTRTNASGYVSYLDLSLIMFSGHCAHQRGHNHCAASSEGGVTRHTVPLQYMNAVYVTAVEREGASAP